MEGALFGNGRVFILKYPSQPLGASSTHSKLPQSLSAQSASLSPSLSVPSRQFSTGEPPTPPDPPIPPAPPAPPPVPPAPPPAPPEALAVDAPAPPPAPP